MCLRLWKVRKPKRGFPEFSCYIYFKRKNVYINSQTINVVINRKKVFTMAENSTMDNVANVTMNMAAQQVAGAASSRREYKYWLKQQALLNEQQQAAEKRQFDYQKSLSDYAYQKNLEQWNAENAYNSPLAQMQRYRVAGLNANLAMSEQNLAGASPEMSIGGVDTGVPSASGVRGSSAFPSFDYVHAMNETKVADAQAKNLNAETLQKLFDYGVSQETRDTIIKQAAADLGYTISETDLNKAQTTGQVIENKINEEIAPTRIEQAAADLQHTRQQNRLIDETIDKMHFEKQYTAALTRLTNLKADVEKIEKQNRQELLDAEKKLKTAQAAFYNQSCANLAKEYEYLDDMQKAKLALLAAQGLNATAFANFADARTDYQKFVNKMNDILLDPTTETDASTYFKALILKNLDETSFIQVVDEARKIAQASNDAPSIVAPSTDTPSSVTSSSSEVDKLTGPGKNIFDQIKKANPDASDDTIIEYIKRNYGGSLFQ